jgi:N-acetylglutamate synthase-like GNAT family acetyltransferase
LTSLLSGEDVVASDVASANSRASADYFSVRRAKLADAEAIAAFVNAIRLNSQVKPRRRLSQREVAQRFGQVGFMVAEDQGGFVGLLGWQVENLVVRVTDFLVAYTHNPAAVGRVLVARMEDDSAELLAEAVILILPNRASEALVTFWETLGYEFQSIAALPSVWREAVVEHGLEAQGVMVKRLRGDLVRRPI